MYEEATPRVTRLTSGEIERLVKAARGGWVPGGFRSSEESALEATPLFVLLLNEYAEMRKMYQ